MEILGVFKNVDEAGRAVTGLLDAGFPERSITSITSVPYPDGVLVSHDRKSWFHRVTLAGGALGALLGFLLAAGTAWLYPLQTGDKPIISPFPTGIITYEFMMLFALAGTFIGMLVEMKLPSFERRAYDPQIADGFIGISLVLENARDREQAETLMQDAGALRIRDNEVVG